MIIGVALGSNLGDRRKHLDDAVDFLQSISARLALSSYYISQPVNCPPGSDYFYNAVAEIEYPGGPEELLEQCQQFELRQGRATPAVRAQNSPRTIDLDLLYAGDIRRSDTRLTLPHPRLARRLFVLEPLAELSPALVVPGLGAPVLELLKKCRQTEKDQICLRIV